MSDAHPAYEAAEASYALLGSFDATVYRMAGCHPGPTFDAFEIAAMTGMSSEASDGALHRLADVGLVQRKDYGRYELHRVVCDHARNKSRMTDPEEVRKMAIESL